MNRCKMIRLVGILFVLASGAFVSASAAQESACSHIDVTRRIVRFGVHKVSSERANTLDDLRRLMEQHRTEFEGVLNDEGLGHLIDGLYEAVQTGQGVTERTLEQGESYDWMASRREGKVVTSGPVCLETVQTYEGYEIKVTVESIEPAQARCSLRANGSCADGTLSVDASGSSDGVSVTMSGNGESASLLSGGAKTWSGSFDNRYHSDYTFTATAQASGSRTVTTHTFVVPKICLNLSYVGEPEVVEEQLADSCMDSARVDRCVTEIPSCRIELTPSVARTNTDVQVGVSGHWDGANPDGFLVAITGPDGQPFDSLTKAETVIFPRPGTYTLTGTAINEAGDTASCSAEIVVDPRLTVRGFGVGIRPDAGSLRTVSPIAGGQEFTELELDSGYGVGGDIEFHQSARLGLMASLIVGRMESLVEYDVCCVWEMAEEDLQFLSLTVGPNIHLTPGKRADLYFGPFVGFVSLGGGSFNLPSKNIRIDLGSELAVGLLLGLDIPLGAHRIWGLHFGARYYDLKTGGLDVNPFLKEFGLFRRF